jgi:hypothetical protein
LVGALALLQAGSANAQVACGDVITDSQVMASNLDSCVGTAVTIGSSGSLDMNGYEITLPGAEGVVMNGSGGTLKNGTVQLCGLSGVVITGDGNKVENVGVRTCFNGFEISGEKNKIERGVAVQNTNEGFLVLPGALKASIKQSYSYNNTENGFRIDGEGTKIAGAVAYDNSESGFDIAGDKTKLSDVLSLENDDDGIVVTGSDAKLQRVFSVQNGARDIGLDGVGAKLKQGTTVGSNLASIWISGNGNSVDKAIASFGFNNLFVAGDQNKAQRLLSVRAAEVGIDVGGSANDNAIKKSFSTQNQNVGIRVSNGAAQNDLRENIASDHSAPWDLLDLNPACGSNNWQKNGGVANDPCID